MRWWRVIVGGLLSAVIVSGALLVRVRTPAADTTRSTPEALGQLAQPALVHQPELTAPPIEAQAATAVVIDAGSGRTLVAKDAHRRVPIASTTKVMSAIVVLRAQPNLEEVVTVSPAAASQTGSLMGIAAGERLSKRALLQGSLLVSGNDAIYALAEHQGGVAAFVSGMNQTAHQLGLTESQFRDPAGLDDQGTSSANDLVQLLRYALTFETFREIIASPSIEISSSTDHYELTNSNRLVRGDEPLYFPDSLGGKTGFTPDAGHCLVAAARRDGHVLIVAVLASDDTAPDASAREALRLLSWTFDHTTWK